MDSLSVFITFEVVLLGRLLLILLLGCFFFCLLHLQSVMFVCFFLVSTFWGFFYQVRMPFFMLSRFFLIANDIQGTLRLTLGLVGMHLTAISMWEITKFYIRHLDYVFQIFPEKYYICFLQFPYIDFFVTISKWRPVILWSVTYLFLNYV